METGQKVNSLEETYELGHHMACRISNSYHYASNNEFLAVTKQLYEWFSPSICLFVTPFDYVPIR